MPNWCQNTLGISGKEEDMEMFISKIKENVGSGEYKLLENLYPMPQELDIDSAMGSPNNWTEHHKSNVEKYGHTDWYDWRIANWGTKWTESDLRVAEEYNVNKFSNLATIAFAFETAWSPPIEAFNKIAADYPKLLFTLYYEETGMGFCGSDVWANGDHVESDSAELISDYFDEEYLYKQYIEKK